MFFGNAKLKNVFSLGFLLALQLAFIAYVNSTFLSSYAGEDNVGFIFMASSASSVLFLFLVPGILEKMGAYRFIVGASGISALSLLLLSSFDSLYGIIPVFIIYFTLNSLIIFALDELVQIYSKNENMGRVRGLYLTVINLAWVFSMAVSGRTLANFSFSTIYLVGFAIMTVFFIAGFLGLKDIKDPEYDKTVAWDSFKEFFRSRDLARSYKLNFLLQFFFATMVIYMPIYLYAHLGFDWKDIGTIFMFMLLPFVLIMFPLGKHSDKVGERSMLLAGFSVLAASTLALFFITRHEVWIWAAALFMTRVGAAIIEVMADVYFFKHIHSEIDEFIGIYRNAAPMAYILAPLLASFILLITPSFNYLFAVLGSLMLYGIYLASTIRRDDM